MHAPAYCNSFSVITSIFTVFICVCIQWQGKGGLPNRPVGVKIEWSAEIIGKFTFPALKNPACKAFPST